MLTQLQALYLSSNSLSGTIPSTLGQLSQLEIFYLSSNSLSGTIPSSLGQLLQLQDLYLYSNFLTGTFPSSLGHLSQLQVLYVDSNSLTGSIPSSLGESTQLQDLFLYSNHFTGTIPTSCNQLLRLRYLYLDYNHISGSIFDTIASLSNLVSISISNNLFSGNLPNDYSYHPYLEDLSASSNCFSGSISTSICSLELSMRSFDLSGAGTNSDCPSNAYITKLIHSFFIKGTFSSIGIEGTIPPCIFSFPNLNSLFLSGNKLSGSLSELISTTNTTLSLTTLVVSNNDLTGNVPTSIQRHLFLELDLSKNRLDGTLVSDFAVSSNQTSLSLSVNRFSGSLPNTFSESATSSASSLTSFTVLAGNLFDCNVHEIPRKDPNAGSYSCGSGELNIAVYSWLSVGALLLLVLLSWRILHCSDLLKQSNFRNKVENSYRSIMIWWEVSKYPYAFQSKQLGEENNNRTSSSQAAVNSADRLNVSVKEPTLFNNISIFLSALKASQRWGLVMIGMSITVTLPIYVSMNNSSYAILTETYGYSLSITFLHDYGLVIFIGLYISALIIILSGILTLSNSQSPLITEKDNKSITTPAKMPSPSIIKIYCIFVALHLINITVTVTVNASYMLSLLNSSKFTASSLRAIQVGVGFFKSLWYNFYVRGVTAYLMSYISIPSAFQHRLYMSVINFIVAPVIATTAANQSCFYYVISPNDQITSVGFAPIFAIYNVSGVGVTSLTLVPFESSSLPAYHYSYACGSALFQSYVPVLIYSYISFVFVIPAMNMCKILFERLFDEEKFLVKFFLQVLSIDLYRVDGKVVLFDVVIHSIVFLTFGLASSILGLMIGMGIIIHTLVYQLQVGRLLYLSYITSKHFSSAADEAACEKQLQRLDIIDAWQIIPSSVSVVAIVVFLFWGFLFFDMIADKNGWVVGLITSSVIAVLCPSIIIISRRFNLIKSWALFKMRVKNASKDINGDSIGIGSERNMIIEIVELEAQSNAITNPMVIVD